MPHIASSYQQLAQLSSHIAGLGPQPSAVDHKSIWLLFGSQPLLQKTHNLCRAVVCRLRLMSSMSKIMQELLSGARCVTLQYE